MHKGFRCKKKNIAGQRFSHIVVMREVEKNNGQKTYECKCDCGKIFKRSYSNITTNKNKNQSCGCMRPQWARERRTTHGCRNTRLYRIWGGIKARCNNTRTNASKTTKYAQTYTKNNITICDEWKNDFVKFKNWAESNGYTDELTIDRINNDGNYEPSNCQWISKSENSSKDSKGKSSNKIRKLTDSDIHEIRKLLSKKELSQEKIAKQYNVEKTTISRIKRNIGICYGGKSYDS